MERKEWSAWTERSVLAWRGRGRKWRKRPRVAGRSGHDDEGVMDTRVSSSMAWLLIDLHSNPMTKNLPSAREYLTPRPLPAASGSVARGSLAIAAGCCCAYMLPKSLNLRIVDENPIYSHQVCHIAGSAGASLIEGMPLVIWISWLRSSRTTRLRARTGGTENHSRKSLRWASLTEEPEGSAC